MMKKNRKAVFAASLILSMTLALSAPLMAAGAEFPENASGGETTSFDPAQAAEDPFAGGEGFEEGAPEMMEEPELKTYTVTYDLRGHGDKYTEEVEEGSFADGAMEMPEADGYTFTAWYTDKDCTSPWDGIVTSNMTVYAGWEKIQEEPAPQEEQEVIVEEPEVQPEIPEQEEVTPAPEEAGQAQEDNTASAAENTVEAATEADASEKADEGKTQAAAEEDNSNSAQLIETGGEEEASAANQLAGTAPTGGEIAAETPAAETATENNQQAGETRIKTQPKNVTVKEGGKASFTVEAVTPAEVDSYEWKAVTIEGGKAVTLKDNKKSKLEISSVKEADTKNEYFCVLKFKDGETEESTHATLAIEGKKIAVQPVSKKVNYPAGATFTVTAAENVEVTSYKWEASDGKKTYALEGTSAATDTLVVPSTRRDDGNKWSFRCKLTFADGSSEYSDYADLKVENTGTKKAVLYIGNYAIDLNKENSGKTFDLKTTGFASGSIVFNQSSNTITLKDVVITTKLTKDDGTGYFQPFDYKLSPATGLLLLDETSSPKDYSIVLEGDNKVGIGFTNSIKDTDGAALNFEFKKAPVVTIKGEGTLQTTGGKKGILSDANLRIDSSVKVVPSAGTTVSNGLEAKGLVLEEDAELAVNAYGSAVYVHESAELKEGSRIDARTITSGKPSKNAVVHVGKDLEVSGAKLYVQCQAGEGSSVKTFSGIECAGNMTIEDKGDVLTYMLNNMAGKVYGIKTSGKLSITDSRVYVDANYSSSKSTAAKGSKVGVLCGKADISLSKEKTYTVAAQAADGIAFAARTGKSGSSKQSYKADYKPARIKFTKAGILYPYPGAISTGSIKNDSKYDYVETVYNTGSTSAPSDKVQFESTVHTWGEPSYTWSADNKTVTAKVTCKNYPTQHAAEAETETAATTSAVDKAATCTAKGTTKYTASFKNSAFTTQTKTVENINALGHKFGEWVVTKKATLNDTGVRQHKCERCGEVVSEVIPRLEKGTYKVTKGESLTWSKGSSKSLEIKLKRTTNNDKAFEHFQGILVDGKVLGKSYYTAKSGSVIITFKPDFLSKLAVGTHTLTYGFEDGDNPTSKLTIQSASSNSSSNANRTNGSTTSSANGNGQKGPATGDPTNIALWIGVMIAAGVVIWLIQRSKKKGGKKDGNDTNAAS